ncbi:beta-ribofuranosylaminobenzene 5'-phosphate synthase [Candidatus Poribacteria bacterium]|nr:beta-ribofuranosylaminobenzene 5'-phosphate synthase [Candidatus Poribacteria bacterium]
MRKVIMFYVLRITFHVSHALVIKRTMKKVIITTPSRLHFALIDLNGSLGRVDGGVGLALTYPCFQIIATSSMDVQIVGSTPSPALPACGEGRGGGFLSRAEGIINLLKSKYNFNGIRIEIAQSIPAHTGLGSGTQLSLGIAAAVGALNDINFNIEETALLVGRGGTSGIGVAAFCHGGFIIDGGHRFPAQKSSFLPSSASGNVAPPPVLFRQDFPDWPVLIVIPNCRHISGAEEVRLFTTLCPMLQTDAQQLSHLILMKLLPALVENDLIRFGEAINQIQEIGWKKIEVDAQGTIIQQTMAFLRNNGAIGVGLSSWGPTLYALGEDVKSLQEKTKQFLARLPEGGTCFITKANNIGAQVKRDA